MRSIRRPIGSPLWLGAAALFVAALAVLAPHLEAQSFEKFFPAKDLTTVGVYYYPEHWDPGQWERDFKNMAAMGFEFTHFAEFAWAQLEPEEGKYDFAWLDRAVQLAAKYQLKVIMCTLDGDAAGLAGPQVPGGPGHRRRRHPDGPRRTPARHLLERLLPPVLPEDDRTAGAPLRQRRTSHRVAARQRAAAIPRLREGRSGSVQGLAREEVRNHRRAEPGLGHGLLERHLLGLLADRPSAPPPVGHEPAPAAGPLPLRRRRNRDVPGRPGQGDPEVHQGEPVDHHELHPDVRRRLHRGEPRTRFHLLHAVHGLRRGPGDRAAGLPRG